LLAPTPGVSDTDRVTRRRNDLYGDQGFSLIELLVVIVIVAILAAIAIPIYLSQREKAQIVSIQSTLKSAATHVEGFAVGFSGDYSALDEQPATALIDEGYRNPWWAEPPGYVTIEASTTRYCIQARHKELSPTNEWRQSTFDSENPRPLEIPNTCPEL
jgi:type IV pilus assembly protein PilA